MAKYIDADALMDFLTMVPIDLGDREIEDVKNYAKNAPAADVRENRHGRWKKESDYLVMGEGYIWFCSECGFTMYFDKNGIHNNFCPNCGADMRGEQQNE